LEIDKMAKSEYLQREDAAKKQLGAKGVAKRVKQVPRAARLSVKELTGVNISRKGVSVDPGAAALAAAGFIPFGKSLSVAAKALKPAGMRISGAASRVVKGATSRLSAAEARIAAGEGMQAAASATRVLAGSVPRPGRTVRLGLDFANPSGNKPHQSYSYVIKDMTKKVNPEAPVSGAQMFEAARSMNLIGANTAYNAAKAARRSQKVIDAGKAGAAAEIKRRLAALQRANRNR
jgi:hypothetical protein